MVVGRGPAARLRRQGRSQDAASLAPEAIDQQTLEQAVRDELERRERAQQVRDRLAEVKARVEAQATEQARYSGGPCAYCGVQWSAERDARGGVRPRWHQVTAGPCCAICDEDRHPLGGSIPLTDEQHRERVVRRLVGEDVARRWWGSHILKGADFKWWHETPDASPGERFAYVDVGQLQAALTPDSPGEPGYTSGEPCSHCGCAHMWVLHPERVAVMTHDPVTGNPLTKPRRYTVPAAWVCHGCRDIADINVIAERLVGIDGSRREWSIDAPTAAQRIGLTWYEGRIKSRDGRRDLTLTPFAYLDLDELRRKAFELFPGQDMWRSKAIWQRLREEVAGARSREAARG
ncbi:hypothetical protein ABZ647_17725 [Micromonospora aurantiaca]|uniref:hypothetical protein n=1 Tax=Micromonospora aurantiaca (nom. illeg.) TaxID=47850 RepID=UPI0033F7A926